jgi:hypothetical protein
MCLVEGCIINPYYNFKGERPQYCKRHIREGMINVKDKRCIHPECTKARLYGNPNESPIYCASHKLEGMINKRSKQCIQKGCTTIPAYAEEGQRPIYCNEHKKEGMINVVRRTCMDCEKTALYNKKGERPLYCSEHNEEGMVDVIHKKCLRCDITPNYGVPNGKPIYCSYHRLDGMIDTRLKPCKTHLCDTPASKTYDGYCTYCFVHLFPDNIHCKNYKTKERCVAEYIQSHSTYTWICDKKIQDGCSRRRPDLMLDLGFQVILVEIDENQHINYDTTCENKRMMELSQDVGHRPVVMIRFNPDEYTDTEKHSSCWYLDIQGLCQLKRSKEKEWNHRLEVLMEQINLWTTKPTEKTIEIIQLFYSI